MKGRLKGSYTVEAAFVMAVVIWVLFVSIQAGYRLRDQVVGSMAFAEAAQRLRHNETEQQDEAINWAAKRAGQPFSWKQYDFLIKRSGNPITGESVKGSVGVGGWKMEFKQGVFDPEDFLRRLTLFHQEE